MSDGYAGEPYDEATGELDEDETEFSLMRSRVPLQEPPAELVAFVEGTLLNVFFGARREAKMNHWYTRWAEHPDAVHRLAAIYDEWTAMMIGGKGAPTLHEFQRDVIDYHRPFLTGSEGHFTQCDADGHHPYARIDAARDRRL